MAGIARPGQEDGERPRERLHEIPNVSEAMPDQRGDARLSTEPWKRRLQRGPPEPKG